MWCIAPKEDARFVAAMEDVLEVYERPYDPARPVVCLDEAAKQINRLSEKCASRYRWSPDNLCATTMSMSDAAPVPCS